MQTSNTQPCDLVVYAPWILPVVPTHKLYKQCALVIDKGMIRHILPMQEAQQRYAPKESLHLDKHLLMPGLINAHGHSAMSLLRGFADDLTLQTWLKDHIWPIEGRHVDATFVREGTQLALAEMIRSGTTCFSDMYFFPEESAAIAHKTTGINSIDSNIPRRFEGNIPGCTTKTRGRIKSRCLN